MRITLNESATSLNEVMVVGYQDVRKKDLTGSVAKANITDMLKAPVPSFDQMLAGRVAGVNVSSGEGTPGSTMNIVIRGNNSITQDNSPLYVIDGFPVEDPSVGASLNPNDIESLDVLKDASATAIYGARGANGVIIISTKKGKIGAPVISYDGSYGVQRASHLMKMLNAYDFVKLQSEIYTPSDINGTYGYFQTYNGKKWTLEDYRNVPQIDWQNQILRDAPQQSHNLSMSGGTANERYAASLSYFNQDGIVLNSNFSRMQARLNSTVKRDKLNVNFAINYSSSITNGSSPSSNQYSGMNNLFYSVWGYRPTTPPNVSLSSLMDNGIDEGINTLNDYRFNPILSVKNEYRRKTLNNGQFNAFAEYEFVKGLKLKISGGYTMDSQADESFNNSKTRYGSPISVNHVNATVANFNRRTWLNENVLTYQTNINKIHSINALVGVTEQASDYRYFGASTINIPFESLGIAGMYQGTPAAMPTYSSNGQMVPPIGEESLLSYLARVNYNYKSRYYLTASFRADASSKFSSENRWGYFPSTSVAWNFTEENFMKSLKSVINSGKLRASWGETGNNRVNPYDRFAQLAVLPAGIGDYGQSTGITDAVYPFNNQVATDGVAPTNLPNKSLKWETTTQTNIGLDLSLLKDRISLNIDWYDKVTSDLLLRASLPYSSGYGSAMKNIGKVENSGIEFTINTTNVQTKKFRWTSNFNIAFNNNKVLELADNQLAMLTNAYFDNGYTSPNYIARVGLPIGMMYGYVYQGTYKYSDFNKVGSTYILKPGVPYYTSEANTQPGMPKYADLNGDHIVNSSDQTIIGRGAPIHLGGFTNNFEYAGFDLGVFLQWSYGNDILNANKLLFENANGKKDLNQFASYANRWTVDNPMSDIPRSGSSSSNALFSSRVIEDGSYIRLKTVSLGYNLNAKWLKSIKMTKARVYVSAQNLFTLTNYTGYDPEVSIRNSALTPGLDFSSYPRAATVTMGVNLIF